MNIYQRPSTYQYCTVGSTIMGKISLSCLLTVELYTYIYTDCISSLSLYAIQADVTFVHWGDIIIQYTLYNNNALQSNNNALNSNNSALQSNGNTRHGINNVQQSNNNAIHSKSNP